MKLPPFAIGLFVSTLSVATILVATLEVAHSGWLGIFGRYLPGANLAEGFMPGADLTGFVLLWSLPMSIGVGALLGWLSCSILVAVNRKRNKTSQATAVFAFLLALSQMPAVLEVFR